MVLSETGMPGIVTAVEEPIRQVLHFFGKELLAIWGDEKDGGAEPSEAFSMNVQRRATVVFALGCGVCVIDAARDFRHKGFGLV